jgi:hypothetical protein
VSVGNVHLPFDPGAGNATALEVAGVEEVAEKEMGEWVGAVEFEGPAVGGFGGGELQGAEGIGAFNVGFAEGLPEDRRG